MDAVNGSVERELHTVSAGIGAKSLRFADVRAPVQPSGFRLARERVDTWPSSRSETAKIFALGRRVGAVLAALRSWHCRLVS